MYIGYTVALEMCSLETLYARRQKRCLDFALKCTKNPVSNEHYIRDKEMFKVNFARTNTYKISAIPFCQRLLNDRFSGKSFKI